MLTRSQHNGAALCRTSFLGRPRLSHTLSIALSLPPSLTPLSHSLFSSVTLFFTGRGSRSAPDGRVSVLALGACGAPSVTQLQTPVDVFPVLSALNKLTLSQLLSLISS